MKMDCNPVISLIIVENSAFSNGRLSKDGRVLVCVRDPIANGDHHPNVLSVPTRRIPKALFQAIRDDCREVPIADRESSLALESDWVDSDDDRKFRTHNPVIFFVKALLSEKLGVNEERLCSFRAKPVWIESGNAIYSKSLGEKDELEPIDMLEILVLVSKPDIFPKSTYSYSHILWSSISKFLAAYEKKDVQCIDPKLDAIELCIHGLCVAGAYEYLKRHTMGAGVSDVEKSFFAMA
jgi:hypothetical protein